MNHPMHLSFDNDYPFVWRPGRVYVPALFMTGMSVSAINEGGASNDAYGINWESSHTGAATAKEISTFGINGVLVNTDGQMIHHDMRIPFDFDPEKKLYFRVHWTCGSTDAADTVLWKALYRAMIPEVTALAVPATAFDTILVEDTAAGVAYAPQATEWAVINGKSINEKAEYIAFHIEMDTKDTDMSEDLFLLGFELMYSPRRLHYGDGMRNEAKPARALIGKTY